ncbi:ATP-binding protein [Nocardioides marmoribigeumensis]|uniref:Anti-sigma regulatory factor (Ser/Thr protein kinase) n=1 Tax=Nocardioides marmoribigeumensis TaxID=433649 RepID=A0ABU2BY31_9ACTN|nr:SpoIIE family protein phosphatase [Nocardioides marmoribigeumensis]MDR7363294.1 anti-sigma regulatory factor (Ser/Thr protein kinase) [Nocardioides marmoribigeumensis]
MAALSLPGEPQVPPTAAVWVAVDDAAAVPGARRRAASLASTLGFPADVLGEVEIIASELATNLVKHGRGGDLVLRTTAAGTVQLLAIDSGPGTRDLAGLVRDGVSTTGTLGVGLGAVGRLADHLDLWSEVGRGAVVVAEVGPPPVAPRAPVGHLLRPLRGEIECGDAIAWRQVGATWLVAVADGLGHGPLAAEASGRAAHVLRTSPSTSPVELVGLMHRALAATRGAAVAVSRVDPDRGTVTHAAVGNVSGRLVDASGGTRALATQPGIVGHKLPRVRENAYPLDTARLLVLHSDGLTDKWSGSALPDVDVHGPDVCAAALVRDAGTRRDDAGVLTLRLPSPAPVPRRVPSP